MKNDRKTSKLAFTLFFTAACALSCSDGTDELPGGQTGEEDGQEEVTSGVKPVTNLKAETTFLANQLQVTWTVPGEAAITEIKWWADSQTEAEAQTERVLRENELLITVPQYGLYHIAATAIDNFGNRSEQTEITATPRQEDAPTRFEQTGDRLLIADPYCFYHDGTYYAYGTQYATGFPVYTSKDLEHWVEHRAMQNTDSWGSDKKTWWAAEVYEHDGKFYMFYVINEQVCVAISEEGPQGPFKQPLRKPLFAKEKNIDPHLFIDDDGTPYLYFVRFTGGNVIWVAEMEKDLMSIKENTLTECIRATDSWEKKQGSICEGPSIIKRNGTYYLIYSANHYQCKDYAVGYATSDSPMGPWKKYEGNPILRRDNPAAGGLAGVGHGAPFQCADGSWKYIFHAHQYAEEGSEVGKRSSYINDLHFSPEGEIYIEGNLIRPVVGKEVYYNE